MLILMHLKKVIYLVLNIFNDKVLLILLQIKQQ
jgi:hypothetical protein